MKNFAIFIYSRIGKNQGGPSGYLYNLIEGMNCLGEQVKLFSICQPQSSIKDRKISIFLKTSFNPIIVEICNILYIIKKGLLSRKNVNKEIHNYRIIHVHSCEDVFFLRKFIKYKGNIILTSHRPEPLYQERIEKLKIKYNTKWRFPLLHILMYYMEIFGYKESKAFIFPCEQTFITYKEFPGFAKYSINKPIEYVYTGVKKSQPTITKEDYRNMISINDDDKMISFIGRHNYIKGYDLLVLLSEKFEKDNIKVVCAGSNDLLSAPNSPIWIELGHINDPYNLINASDIVVIPNRKTYFDLIIIEALSLGKIVVTSDTGGNLDISKHTRGLRLFKSGDAESLYKVITEIFELKEEEKEILKNENLKFYNEFCTLEKFAENYLYAVNKICSKLQ